MTDLYKTYIPPNLEYCPQLWNPTHSTLALKIEKMQYRSTRLLPNGRNMSHDERNAMLGITSHEERKRRGNMLMVREILE